MKREKIKDDMWHLPKEVLDIIKDADVYDSSCSQEAKVYYIDKEGGMFLKIAPAGSLKDEAEMTSYYYSLGLSAEVLFYLTILDHDYMISRRIPGEDCTYDLYMDDPKRLCDTTAGLLRELHEKSIGIQPPKDCIKYMIDAVNCVTDDRCFEPELFKGLWEFKSFDEAKRVAFDGINTLKRDVLIHGDYCLPNIILKDWKLSGYIDLGNAGIGDRHMDILWGIWTLNFNLKTTAYTERFMDAYGRDRIEEEKLRHIAAMQMVVG